nr:hypothetical protein [Tanacetum cinerariifolium]
GEGSGIPSEPHHTPFPEAKTSHPTTSSIPLPSIPTVPIPPVTQPVTTSIIQYSRRARIAQSSAHPTVADEPASPVRDVSEGEACPTESGFIVDQDRTTIVKSSSLPHDLAPRVTSPAADEGSVAAKQSRDDAPIKGRSINEGEAAAERINTDSEEIARVLTSMDACTRAARRWLEKEPPRSIHTWEDLVSKFIKEFFPPSRTTNLHQDSLNAAAGGNFLERSTQDVLTIIENKSKVRNSRSKPVVSQVKACDVNSSSEIAKLTHAVNQQTSVVTTVMTAMLKQFQATPPPAPVKAVEETCVTCGGAHPYYQCLAPTEGYEDAIVVPAITANNFELKHGLFTLNKQFFGHDKEDPHAHVRYFNKITSTLKFPNVSNTSIKLMLFLFSLEGAAWIWLEKEPPRLIFTWDDLVSKFINQFFSPSKTTNLRNEITNFQQRFDESFSEAWDRFKDLIRACPHHGFLELQQLDTFYNALNSKDQDSLNSAVGGNFFDKMPRECLAIIESKSKVHYSRNKPVVAKVSTNASTSSASPDVAELKDMVKALLLDKKSQNQSPAPVKAVEESCVTCGDAYSYRYCPATNGNNYRDNIQEFVSQASAVNYNQGKTSYRPPMMSNQIRPPGFPPDNNFNQGPVYQPPVFQQPAYQAPAYQAPAPQSQGVSKEDFSAYVKANDAMMKNMQMQGQNMQNQLTNLTDFITKFVNSNTASTSSSGTLPSNTIANLKSDLKAITTRSGVSYDGPQIPPPPSSLPKVVENEPEVTKDTVNPTNNENIEDVQPQAVQSESPVLISKPITSPISEPATAPVSASKPNPKASIPYPSKRNDERNPLIGNKEKLSEMARTPLNEHCSAVLLKKLPEKLGDPGKFLIPCDFLGMAECLVLADLDASINLMPFSVWKILSLPDLTPTCMTLELADRSISCPVGVAEDVYIKVGSFYFSADFVVVDFVADPRVPLILRRSFLKTGRALIDMFEGELTLREVLGFSDTISSGNPTSFYDSIIYATSPTLTPFGNSDFLLEEVDAFLAIEDEPTSSEFYQPYLDPEGDILLLEVFLNDDPSLPPPNQRNYLPEVLKELKICEAKSDKSSVDEPLVVKLKDLPPHLEYAFLEGDDKLPVIIVNDLSVEEKTALITVLKSHKRAIA